MDPTDEIETPAEDAPEKPADEEAEQASAAGVSPGPTVNILPQLQETVGDWLDQQCKIGARRTKDAIGDREEFMQRRANQLRLLTGNIPPLGAPAEGARAPALLIAMKAILHMWARTFDQIIPAKGDIIHAVPMAAENEQMAIERERHLNWQLRTEMPEWAMGHRTNMFAWYSGGSTFRRYRYDPVEEKHCFDYYPMDDVIIAYKRHDDDPLMKDVPWMTFVLRLPRWKAEIYEEKGFWSGVTGKEAIYPDDEDDSGSTSNTPLAPPTNAEEESEIRRVVIEAEGVEPPGKGEKDGEREYHEHYCRLRFPKGAGLGLDGKYKPVILTFDKLTKKPVALTIREEPVPADQARFDAEMQAYSIASANDQKQAAASGTTVPARTEPKPPRTQVIYDTVHYRLFPNPDGFYGLGMGYLLEGPNELANALAGEYLIGAKFENLKGGWMAKGTREKRGDVPWVPGKFVETEIEPELLDKAIKEMRFSPPSEGLMRVVAKLEENAEIAADTEVLSGEKGSSNETAKGLQIRNANAMTLIMVITRMYLEFMKYEVQMIVHGNAVQMTGPKTFPFRQQTAPDKSTVTMTTVTPQHYQADVEIEFTADARAASKPERVADAKDFLQAILNSPMAQNPQMVDFAFRHLWRMAERPDFEAAMGPPPPPPGPPPPPQPQSQDTENAGFFNEQDHPVLPDDNHMEHLHKINELRQSPLHEHLSSTGKQMLDRHERAHVSQFYLQMQALKGQTGMDVHRMAGLAGGSGGPGVPHPPASPPGGGNGPSVPTGPGGVS